MNNNEVQSVKVNNHDINRKIYCVGNAHLDPVWLWRWQEGFAEIKATFRSALDRMNEYPDFIFTCAGTSYYKWVEDNAPEMFEEVRKRIAEDRWVIAGGWWVQPDCNLPSGESIARHSLYGQRYYMEKFGVLAKTGYNVDSFGHSNTFPQILLKSGMSQYVFMRPMANEKTLPGDLFYWESIDGSRVMAYRIPNAYNNFWGREDTIRLKLEMEIESTKIQGIDMMYFFGVGNHGGGPTIANIKRLHELRDEYGHERFFISSPDAYFEDMRKNDPDLPLIFDDLQIHSIGCYSAHAEIKALNRRVEHRLISAEKFMSLSSLLADHKNRNNEIRRAWDNVMFNHFHDVLCGCCIKEAYEDVKEFYGESLSIGGKLLNEAIQRISWSIDTMGDKNPSLSKDIDPKLWEYNDFGVPVVIFNTNSWELKTRIQINAKVNGVTDDNGVPQEIQIVRASQTNVGDKSDTLFEAEIPPMGYCVYWVYKNKPLVIQEYNSLFSTGDNYLENGCIKLEFEPHTGYIKTLFDKRSNINVLSGYGAVPIVLDDFYADTWAHGFVEYNDVIAKFTDANLKLIESGPLRARLRVTSRYNDSILRQDFILHKNSADIEVRAKIDWREKHKLLKLSFPVNIANPMASYEVPYGFIQKVPNGHEWPIQQWADISGVLADGSVYGLALLNNNKYSLDVRNNDMKLTILRSPIFADHFGERDELCDFMDQGEHEFKYVIVPHTGSWESAGIVKKALELNSEHVHIIETYHKGTLPTKYTGIRIGCDNIIATVFKRAEDNNGYILRCYETSGAETNTEIEIPILDRRWNSDFRKGEIKTFFMPDDKNTDINEVNLLEL